MLQHGCHYFPTFQLWDEAIIKFDGLPWVTPPRHTFIPGFLIPEPTYSATKHSACQLYYFSVSLSWTKWKLPEWQPQSQGLIKLERHGWNQEGYSVWFPSGLEVINFHFKKKIYFLYVALCVCICGGDMCTWRSEKSPMPWSCKYWQLWASCCRYWEVDAGTAQEQYRLLTTAFFLSFEVWLY